MRQFRFQNELIDGVQKIQMYRYECAKRTQKMQASASCKVSSGYRKLWKPFFVSPEVQRTAFCCGDKQNIQKIHSHLWEVFLGMATANFSYTIFSHFSRTHPLFFLLSPSLFSNLKLYAKTTKMFAIVMCLQFSPFSGCKIFQCCLLFP